MKIFKKRALKKRTERTLFAVMCCMIMLLIIGCGTASKQDNENSEKENNKSKNTLSLKDTAQDKQVQAPDFEMELLDGEKASFEEYRGKKVLLNFWATWCGPCVGEMPAFQKLAEENPEKLAVLAVNCSEDKNTVQKFMESNSYTFPVVLDTDGSIQALFGGIRSIPVTVIIDEEGNIVSSHTGAADADTMYQTYKEELGL